jgi:hypothetical protein
MAKRIYYERCDRIPTGRLDPTEIRIELFGDRDDDRFEVFLDRDRATTLRNELTQALGGPRDGRTAPELDPFTKLPRRAGGPYGYGD